MADALLGEHGLRWYEVASFASGADAHCRHNLAYWHGGDWWGVGPGAHSHLDGVRWWNVKRPATWAARVAAGESPAAGREVLTGEQRGARAAHARGPDAHRPGDRREATAAAAATAVVRRRAARREGDRLVLTLRGRTLADLVTRELASAPAPPRCAVARR